jgi:hypothetical protein
LGKAPDEISRSTAEVNGGLKNLPTVKENKKDDIPHEDLLVTAYEAQSI